MSFGKDQHPGAVSILQNVEDESQAVHYTIVGTLFNRNTSPIRNSSTSEYRGSNFKDRGYGGAVFVEFGRNTSESSVTISQSNFTNNSAIRGAGIYAYYQQNAQRNNITIVHCVFSGNQADVSGGGVNIGFFNNPTRLNTFAISHCSFNNNFGFVGSGLAVYSIYDKKRPKEGVIVVSKTSWHNNRGVYGAAVDMTPLDSSNIENEGYLPVPKFSNCTFFNNTVNDHQKQNLPPQCRRLFHHTLQSTVCRENRIYFQHILRSFAGVRSC